MSILWKQTVGEFSNYEVSNTGLVRNKETKKLLKIHKNHLGYEFVGLSNKGRVRKHRVHRLVAFAFLENPENKPNINHLDSNPSNNHVDNLQWCTQSENIKYAYDYGFKKPPMHRLGSKQGSSSQYHNVYLDKSRNRWAARVETTTAGGLSVKRKYFAISRFESSEQAEQAAAYAVNLMLDELKDSTRPRNPIKLTVNGKYYDFTIETSTD